MSAKRGYNEVLLHWAAARMEWIGWGGHMVGAPQSGAALTGTKLPGDSDVQPD